MPVTDEQRENRALYNLSRQPMNRRQLYCASVNERALNYLVEAGAIDADADAFAITNAGRLELRGRITNGRGSTITHVNGGNA